MRHGRVGDGVDHLRAVLDHPALLVVGADHVPGRVLEEEQGDVGLVGEHDELGRLLGLLEEEHASGVGEDADRVAVNRRPPGDEARTVLLLVLLEPRAVGDAGDHLARVEGDSQVDRRDAEQLLLVVQRRVGRTGRARSQLVVVEVGDDVATDADAVEFVDGVVVRESGSSRVHRRAAERLVVGVLTGRHLHERWPAEEHLGAVGDHHGVVAHARDVRTARRAVAEHERDRGDSEAGQLGEVAEDVARRDEEVGLCRQVGAAGFDEVDDRQTVLPGDVERPQVLLQGVRVHRPAAHRRIVGDDDALDVRDDTDAGDDRGADVEVAAVCGERRELEKRRVGIEEQFDPLAGEQLAAGAVALDIALSPTGDSDRDLLVVFGDHREHLVAVRQEPFGMVVDQRLEDGHGCER